MMNTKENYKSIPKEYYQWVQDRLPAKTIKVDLSGLYLDDNFTIYSDQDRTNEKAVVYQTDNEEDIKLWLLEKAARDIGLTLELKNRAIEQLKWRYVWDHKKTTPGHVVLKEHKIYQYDTEYDHRKYWFEYTLHCLKPVCDKNHYQQRVKYYQDLMNKWFETPHWIYDDTIDEFVEIKDL